MHCAVGRLLHIQRFAARVSLPEFATPLDSGHSLYAPPEMFHEMRASAVRHERLLVACMLLVILCMSYQYPARLRTCPHHDLFYCDLLVEADPLLMYFMLPSMFVTRIRFPYYALTQFLLFWVVCGALGSCQQI